MTIIKKRTREEDRASGIAPDVTEIDEALNDLIERFEEADKEFEKNSDKKKNKIEQDQAKAEEMRKRSLETMSETMERNDVQPASKKRNNGTETINYLREKLEREEALRQEELQMKKEEMELSKKREESQSTMLMNMCQNMQNQQQLFMQQQAQQQQQSQALMLALVEKLTKN